MQLFFNLYFGATLFWREMKLVWSALYGSCDLTGCVMAESDTNTVSQHGSLDESADSGGTPAAAESGKVCSITYVNL